LLSRGTDIETVSNRLGHSKASVTLDIYGHALKEMDEAAANTLGALFG
jgi:integrase